MINLKFTIHGMIIGAVGSSFWKRHEMECFINNNEHDDDAGYATFL
jgi:hypothetical protein